MLSIADEHSVPYDSVVSFLRALNGWCKDNTSEVLPLVLDLCLKMEPSGTFLLKHVADSSKIIAFIMNVVKESTSSLKGVSSKKGATKSHGFFKHEPALVWMALQCFPHAVEFGADHSELAWKLAVALEDYIAAFDEGSPLVDILYFWIFESGIWFAKMPTLEQR